MHALFCIRICCILCDIVWRQLSYVFFMRIASAVRIFYFKGEVIMKYCTNCGQETKKKICASCGVKNNKVHKYCGYCGNALDENAGKCPNCGNKTKRSKLPTILLFILGVVSFVSAYFFPPNADNKPTAFILFIISGLLCMPFISAIIQKTGAPNQKIHKASQIVRGILIVTLFFAAEMKTTEYYEPHKIYKDEATDAAVFFFHQDVNLKNEDSFTLYDSEVTYSEEGYNGNENKHRVKVVLDYSAQNGFGGMNRETYTVILLFDETTGKYSRLK